MSGDEIGVEVGEEHVRDAQAVLGREGEILIDVTLGIDDGGGLRLFVANQVRRVGETIQIKLTNDHDDSI